MHNRIPLETYDAFDHAQIGHVVIHLNPEPAPSIVSCVALPAYLISEQEIMPRYLRLAKLQVRVDMRLMTLNQG